MENTLDIIEALKTRKEFLEHQKQRLIYKQKDPLIESSEKCDVLLTLQRVNQELKENSDVINTIDPSDAFNQLMED